MVDTKSAVRKCSILSLLLFILHMELVIKEVHRINDNDNQFIQAYMGRNFKMCTNAYFCE